MSLDCRELLKRNAELGVNPTRHWLLDDRLWWNVRNCDYPILVSSLWNQTTNFTLQAQQLNRGLLGVGGLAI